MKNYPLPTHKLAGLTYCRLFLTVSFMMLVLQACAQQNIARPTRANSFFGVHFDFHAKTSDTHIGSTLTPGMVDSFLQTVRPDFIQVDTKGHTGVASYPTKVGVAARIVKDPLKIFRDATAKRGVALYSHYSSIMDIEVLKNHPQWAQVNAAGAESDSEVSIFSPYTDSYLIPQLKEISNYGLDGFWIDGDNWALKTDYSAPALKAYSAARGKRMNSASDVNQKDYLQFTRQSFRKYLNHYVNALKKYNPKLQIGSSWAFTARMPGPVDAPVDFLSGDLATTDISETDYQTYGMASQGLPWDLMGWAVNTDNLRYKYPFKSPAMLKQQAAVTIAQGGAYQVYVVQNRDASIPTDNTLVQTLKEVRDFCYARKPYCFKTTPLPQVALFLSAAGHDKESAGAFDNDGAGLKYLKTTLDMLLDAQYSVQVLNEFSLKGKTSKYPLIVVPQWNYIAPAMLDELKQYVQNGGRVVAIGPSVSKMITGALANGTNYDNASGLQIKSFNYGKGVVCSVVPTIAQGQLARREGEIRKVVGVVLKRVFPDPVVTIDGSDDIHVNAATKNGETLISLVNVSKLYADGGTLPNAIKTTPALNVTLRVDKRPSAIVFQPDGTNISFTYSNGVAKFTTPGVNMYSIIQVK
ncbi:MAG: alpha-amylase family protein [Mucilaginibacter sp.]